MLFYFLPGSELSTQRGLVLITWPPASAMLLLAALSRLTLLQRGLLTGGGLTLLLLLAALCDRQQAGLLPGVAVAAGMTMAVALPALMLGRGGRSAAEGPLDLGWPRGVGEVEAVHQGCEPSTLVLGDHTVSDRFAPQTLDEGCDGLHQLGRR